MTIKKKLLGCLLLIFLSSTSSGLVSKGNKETKTIDFADSILECGVYYQYTAGGMKKNPNISNKTVQSVSQNAKTLLETANLLYTSLGISTETKYEALMERAKTMLQQRENGSSSISDLIYETGRKCRLLLANYPSKLAEISTSLELN